MQIHAVKMGLMLVMLMCGSRLRADSNIYYVDIGHPRASDENPGSAEAPWKTLSHAGTAAEAGDTVRIKAGIYRETLVVENDGRLSDRRCLRYRRRLPDRIVFEAYGDDEVIIDGSEVIPAQAWEPVPGLGDVYRVHLNTQLRQRGAPAFSAGVATQFGMDRVFRDETQLPRHQARDALGVLHPAQPGSEADPSWGYDEDGYLYVHLGGADPRRDGEVAVAVRASGATAASRQYITLRGLTVRRTLASAITSGHDAQTIIEDCHIYHSGGGIRLGHGNRSIIRRNVAHEIFGQAYSVHRGFGVQVYDNVAYRHGLGGRGYHTYAFTDFGSKLSEYYHNVSARGHGYWVDIHSSSYLWIGNAAVQSNFYIESPTYHNLVQWNTVWGYRHQGIYLRDNVSNLVRENLVAYSGAGLVMLDNSGRHAMAGNFFTGNWLKRNRIGLSMSPEFGTHHQLLNHAQGNIYQVPEDGYAARWAGNPYRTLEELRIMTGQETLGQQVDKIDLDEIGLVWLRVDDPATRHEPFPMIGNPDFRRLSSEGTGSKFFWRHGDAEGSDTFPHEWSAYVGKDLFPAAGPDGWTRGPRNDMTGFGSMPVIAPVEGTPVNGRVYNVRSVKDAAIDARGQGLWSPSLPVVPGATIDLALWMKTDEIEPTTEEGGAVVYAEWSNRTGRQKSRSYLVGGESAETVVNPEYNRGSRAWSRVSGSVTAPEGAYRFALYLGMRSALGNVTYGAVEEVRTRPGEAPEAVDAVIEADRPLVDPAGLEFSIVDLSGRVNRALMDEVEDDGKGGWTDQGPGYDMAGLETGRHTHEGVPYHILAPQSCIVLASRRRPDGDLPEAVTIPVGEKADILYFLHSGAWVSPAHLWSYELHYEDGTVFEIPVIGNVNIRDWALAGQSFEFHTTDTRRTRVWPDIVGNMLSPDCGLYILEHRNPHPERTLAHIRFTQTELKRSVPILLGITLGRQR